jgi:hypothetical protein
LVVVTPHGSPALAQGDRSSDKLFWIRTGYIPA